MPTPSRPPVLRFFGPRPPPVPVPTHVSDPGPAGSGSTAAGPRAAVRPFGGALPRPPKAAPGHGPDAPEADPRVDPWAMEGWVRIDGSGRPATVSAESWGLVFPPDYPEVRRLAGRYYLFGMEPDDAVARAAAEAEAAAWRDGLLGRMVDALEPFFPGGVAAGLPADALRGAVLAVGSTARARWRDILAAPSPESTAFRLRHWHAPSGRCLVCWRSAPGEGTFQGDAIHAACKPAMRDIGPRFAALVIEASEACRAEEEAQ